MSKTEQLCQGKKRPYGFVRYRIAYEGAAYVWANGMPINAPTVICDEARKANEGELGLRYQVALAILCHQWSGGMSLRWFKRFARDFEIGSDGGMEITSDEITAWHLGIFRAAA